MIVIASDHAALPLKQELCAYLKECGLEYRDVGAFSSQDKENYADIAEIACREIQSGGCSRGILLCGTGIGISMAANKMKEIRAAACSDYFSAKYARLHNDANVLCLGARVVGAGLARELAEVFLNTEFEGGRHAPRVAKIMELENQR